VVERPDVTSGRSQVHLSMQVPGYVYILQSEKNGTFYLGSTNNIEKRFFEHQQGKVKATRYLLPLKLQFCQKYNALKEARQIECKLKKFKRRDIIERIIKERRIEVEGG